MERIRLDSSPQTDRSSAASKKPGASLRRIRLEPGQTSPAPKLSKHGKPIGRPRKAPPRLVAKLKAPIKSGGLTLIDAMDDEKLFAPWFKNRESWIAWRVFIKALFCLPMDGEELALYRQCTGRDAPPETIAKLAYLIVGRRGGKTLVLSLIATYLACFHDFRQYLAPGERGMVQLIASDKKQAKQMLRYIGGFFDEIPLLKKLLEREVAETFDLTNRITIEVTTASIKSTRGFTVVCSILDEAAFFSTDEGSASPDAEILKAIIPSTLTIPNALILVSSSPYARRGILYQAHKDYFGKPERDRTLVWQAPTQIMNPSADADFIAREYEKDPAAAASEYGAQFRSDLESFVDIDVVMACVSEGIFERPRERGTKYVAFLDPAGGSGKDSFTLAIGHRDKASGLNLLDAIRETKPPFSPEVVVADYAKVLKSFGITKCIGDRYAGMWVVEPFRKHGINYDPSAKAKSDLYRDALPLLNSKRADLLDHKRLVQQFVGLERRVARSGKDSIDHAPNGHDDLCNVVAGLLVNLGTKNYRYDSTMKWVSGDTEKDNENWRASQLVNHMMRGSFGRLF